MRRTALTLIGAACIALSSQVASAADMRARPAPVYKAAPAVVAAWDWSGFYVGGQIGWGWADWDTSVFTASVGAPFTAGFPIGSINGDGFVGGGHAGYNFQVSNWVFGIEGDINWTGINGDKNFLAVGIPPGLPFNVKNEIDYYVTLRGRIGWAFDRTLVYVTGGWAWAHSDSTVTSPGQLAGPFTTSSSNTHNGWTLGGGFDYMIDRNWIFGVEYKHLDLGSKTYTYAFPLAPVTGSTDLTIDQVTARLSYKFDWGWGKGPVPGKGPVVTRY